MTEPTRRTEFQADGQLLEWASLNSVELVNSVKDGWRVASVKCYGVSAQAAFDQALAVAADAETVLHEKMNRGHMTP